MALSLDAVFKPLSSFFIDRYKTADGSAVAFRFDKYGSLLSDSDFIDPLRPEAGYSPGLAQEKLSDLVNHIPADAGDGMNVVFMDDAIDDAYFMRLLQPSLPCANGAQADAFFVVKANAVNMWNSIRLESSTGLMMKYKPCLASPTGWSDPAAKDGWTPYAFNVSGDATPGDPQQPPVKQPSLWRLKLDDSAMRAVLSQSALRVADPAPPVKTVTAAKTLTPARMMATSAAMQAAPSVQAVSAVALHDQVRMQVKTLDMGQRMILARDIAASAPVKPAATNSIKVSFDYCLVKVRRPWYVDSFIADTTWCVPPLRKGGVTANAAGKSFTSLPIGFIAVKNLSIVADWPAADLANAAQATHFGPFQVDAGIANNTLGHKSMQVIGWLIQPLPPLPPNDAPVATSQTA